MAQHMILQSEFLAFQGILVNISDLLTKAKKILVIPWILADN